MTWGFRRNHDGNRTTLSERFKSTVPQFLILPNNNSFRPVKHPWYVFALALGA